MSSIMGVCSLGDPSSEMVVALSRREAMREGVRPSDEVDEEEEADRLRSEGGVRVGSARGAK